MAQSQEQTGLPVGDILADQVRKAIEDPARDKKQLDLAMGALFGSGLVRHGGEGDPELIDTAALTGDSYERADDIRVMMAAQTLANLGVSAQLDEGLAL